MSRLTPFYPGRRNCLQWEDQAGLSARIVQAWSKIPPLPPLAQRFHSDGLSADLFAEFSVDEAMQLAAAFAGGRKSDGDAPLLLGMAHPAAVDQRMLAGGILLSSPSGDLRRIELSLFGPGGAPITGEELEKVKRRLDPHHRLLPARRHDCQFSVEPSGRYWWRNQLPAADALGVVTLLLTRQSRIDRSLSSQLI